MSRGWESVRRALLLCVRALRLPKSRRVWASSSVAVARRPRPVRGVRRSPDRPPFPRVLCLLPPCSSAPAREPPLVGAPSSPPRLLFRSPGRVRWGTLGESQASSRGGGRARPGVVPPRAGRLGSTWGKRQAPVRVWGADHGGARVRVRAPWPPRPRPPPSSTPPPPGARRAGERSGASGGGPEGRACAWFPSRGLSVCRLGKDADVRPLGAVLCSRGSRGTPALLPSIPFLLPRRVPRRRAPSGSVFAPHAPARFGRARAAAVPLPRTEGLASRFRSRVSLPSPPPSAPRGRPLRRGPAGRRGVLRPPMRALLGERLAGRRGRGCRRVKVGPDAGPDVPAGRTVLRGGPSASNNGLPARVPPSRGSAPSSPPPPPSRAEGPRRPLSSPPPRRAAGLASSAHAPHSTSPLSRPQIRRGDPLNLSILVSGGKETNQDSLSNGE